MATATSDALQKAQTVKRGISCDALLDVVMAFSIRTGWYTHVAYLVASGAKLCSAELHAASWADHASLS